MEIILAILLGTLFGFVLHRVGASNPENIINMLRLKDLHLMKAILLAIGVASSILFVGLATGFINPSHISIKASYWGVLVGGMILGTGWAIAGYCPGTGVVQGKHWPPYCEPQPHFSLRTGRHRGQHGPSV